MNSVYSVLFGQRNPISAAQMCMCSWRVSQRRAVAIGIIAKDENAEREIVKTKKQCAEVITHGSSSILYP